MKWHAKGFFNYRLESEDGKWEIAYDEFGSVMCRSTRTHKGWLLNCSGINTEAIKLAESRIQGAGN